MLRLEEVDFDVGVLEHGHVPDMEEFFYKGKRRIAIKAGSYKILWDNYADRKGFLGIKAMNPTVILNPCTYEMLPFLDMRDAIKVLKALRGVL